MKQLNKKAAECTAIHPTANKNDLNGSFIVNNITQKKHNEKIETFELSEASRISGIKLVDFISFYRIKGYICQEEYGYSATALGIKNGCVVNDNKQNALFTMKAITKVADAFAV